jgi:hypothetical protein
LPNGEVEAAVDKELIDALNSRGDGKPYPINFPDGWLPMNLAVESLGWALLAEGFHWTYFKWAERSSVVPQHPAVDANNLARIDYAKRYQRNVAEAFSKALITGQMQSGFSRIGGGAVTPIEPDLWRTDDLLLRFRTFSFDPGDPFTERVDLPCWIWIETEGLRHVCDLLKRERNGWGPPPPKPKPRTETYLAEDGSEQLWIYDEDRLVSVETVDPSASSSAIKKGKVGRPTVVPLIEAVFAKHLRAGTVEERVAWEGVAISKEVADDLANASSHLKPPVATTCEDRIRAYFKMIERGSDGRKILNAADVLEAMNYPINPDKSRAIG